MDVTSKQDKNKIFTFEVKLSYSVTKFNVPVN